MILHRGGKGVKHSTRKPRDWHWTPERQGAGTESVLSPHAHSRPIPQHTSTIGDRTSRPPRGSQPPSEARLRAARAEVVVAQGAGPDLVACLPGLGGHVTEARVS